MKAGRREEGAYPWREALSLSGAPLTPLTPGFVVDDATEAAMHGERGRINHKTAYAILALHHQTGRCSQKPGHIEVLHQFTDRRGFGGWEWQTIPLTLGALRDWLGY